jgi:serine protease Do
MSVLNLLRPAACAGILLSGLCSVAFIAGARTRADDLDKRVEAEEAKRVAAVEKVKPTVVAVFSPGGQGGGSGVVITRDGYALTNYHVVQGSGPVMQCGMPDGVLYDSVLVGLDPVGDVALIKLLPKTPGKDFPAAPLGDSDKLKEGDYSLAMGNPFLLATDFTPTVTYGMISGVHRYQYPEGSKGLLEYTDCIQTDTSINPGNSGGPLFNMNGELIGINGRISLEKRGRINSGVGYAISINQIKNFMGHLRAGLQADHATLGAIIENKTEEGQTGMMVTSILENSDARRRGLDLNDELVSFAGRVIGNRNHYQNVLGLFPKGWRVPLVYRRDNDKHEILVRLMGTQRAELDDDGRPKAPQPAPQQRPAPPIPNSPATRYYKAKPGFANFYFNEQETNRLWSGFVKHGDFASLTGTWTIDADLERNGKTASARISIAEEKNPDGKTSKTLVKLFLGNIGYVLDPLKPDNDADALKQPTDNNGSGGFLMALFQYHRLLTLGAKGFTAFNHAGYEPLYPMPADGLKLKSYSDIRVDTEVLKTEHAAFSSKWFFSQRDQNLLGAEVTVIRDEDPCELYFSDYRPASGRQLPYRIEVRYGNGSYGVFKIKSYQLGAK